MLKPIAIGIISAIAAAPLGIWTAVSTDHWPWDDRRAPALAVYVFNRSLGSWLTAHGDSSADPCWSAPQPLGSSQQRGFTPEEMATIQQMLRTDPRLKDRVFLTNVPSSCSSRSRG
jgi:hypothetical protein